MQIDRQTNKENTERHTDMLITILHTTTEMGGGGAEVKSRKKTFGIIYFYR